MTTGEQVARQRTELADEEARRRLRARWAYRGFAIGFVLAIIQSLVAFAFLGWRMFPFQLVWAFVFYPAFSAFVAHQRAVPRDGTLSWRLRFGTRTLLLLVAYCAFLCALGVLSAPIGKRAQLYHGKASSSQSMADSFGAIATKAETEGPMRLRNAEELRAGTIAAGITQDQKDFLRSLEKTATPGYRKERFGLIADGEERLGRLDQHNAVIMRGLTEYYRQLAAKYRNAAGRPWLLVEPDPPMPPTQ